MNVLLTCAGRRHYLASYFKQELVKRGRVVGVDMSLTSPALQVCDAAHKVPEVSDQSYLNSLQEVILAEDIQMVFSLNDLEIPLLSKSRSALEQATGATFYVPNPSTLSICNDKWRTFEFARTIGVPVPETFLSPENAIEQLKVGLIKFPFVIKPRWGSASIGLYVVNNERELFNAFLSCQKDIARSPLSSLGAQDNVIIQELIQGAEYGVDILYSRNENLIGFAAKKKLAMRAGETDKAITVAPERFQEMVSLIVGALPQRGNLDCDFLERDGKLYLLEFNPRFGGGYPFTHMAGANHIQLLLDDYQGNTLSEYTYEVGKGFAKYDSLVEIQVI